MRVTVAQMIEALSALPPGATLVMTEDGYYSYGTEFAEVMLPELYIAERGCAGLGINKGGAVYRIGHSTQNP